MTTPHRFQMDFYNGWSPDERRATLPIQRAAIRSGAMPAPDNCSICGFTGSSDRATSNRLGYHDENYAAPLDAYPICRACHGTLHGRFDRPARWLRLIARYAQPGAWFMKLTMDPASRYRSFGLSYPNGLCSSGRDFQSDDQCGST